MTLRQFCTSLRQLHENPRLIAFAASGVGHVLVWTAATLLLAPSSKVYGISPLLALVLLAPQWRVQILSLGSIWAFHRVLAKHGVSDPTILAGLFALSIALVYLCYLAARSYDRLPGVVQRNSQIVLHLLLCIGLLSTGLVSGWGVTAAKGSASSALRVLLPFLVWRCGYILLSGRRGTAPRSSFFDHFFYSLPAYGGTNIPYGKGYDHLTRQRADDPQARARAALAGIKLLILAWAWTALRVLLAVVVHGEALPGLEALETGYTLDVPRLKEIIAHPGRVALPMAWLSMVLELVDVTLMFASWGHMVIGCLRLFGYNVFRNTYKPLLAKSLVDFWNRFHYYFKELMVEFFFLPTYLSTFKTWPRLRIFTAIMAAACVGNVYYHALGDLEPLVAAGPAGTWALVGPRAFYTLLLALGIFVSMMREQQRRRSAPPATAASPLDSLRRIAGVWLFYAVIHIWNVKPARLTFTQRTQFFLSLFGL